MYIYSPAVLSSHDHPYPSIKAEFCKYLLTVFLQSVHELIRKKRPGLAIKGLQDYEIAIYACMYNMTREF